MYPILSPGEAFLHGAFRPSRRVIMLTALTVMQVPHSVIVHSLLGEMAGFWAASWLFWSLYSSVFLFTLQKNQKLVFFSGRKNNFFCPFLYLLLQLTMPNTIRPHCPPLLLRCASSTFHSHMPSRGLTPSRDPPEVHQYIHNEPKSLGHFLCKALESSPFPSA